VKTSKQKWPALRHFWAYWMFCSRTRTRTRTRTTIP